MAKKQKMRHNVVSFECSDSDSASEDGDWSNKPQKTQELYFSHVNISSSTSTCQTYHSTVVPVEKEDVLQPKISPPASFFHHIPLEGWSGALVKSTIMNWLGVSVTVYTFGDSKRKVSKGKSLAGEDLDANEEETAGLTKEGSKNVRRLKFKRSFLLISFI